MNTPIKEKYVLFFGFGPKPIFEPVKPLPEGQECNDVESAMKFDSIGDAVDFYHTHYCGVFMGVLISVRRIWVKTYTEAYMMTMPSFKLAYEE